MASYSDTRRYIELCLGEEEIQRRIENLPFASRLKSLVRWEGDNTRTPKEMASWAKLAVDLNAATCDGYSISRLQTGDELRKTVIEAEQYHRQYTAKDIPEDLDDPEAAAAQWRAQQEQKPVEDQDEFAAIEKWPSQR